MKLGKQSLSIASLKWDGWMATEMRAKMDMKRVDNYSKPVQVGKDQLWVWEIAIPVIFTCPNEPFFVGDGFHRILAAEKAGRKSIECEVRRGTERDAWLYNIEANKEAKGMDWKLGDMKKAIKKCLGDEELRKSRKSIAALVGCSPGYVSTICSALPDYDKLTSSGKTKAEMDELKRRAVELIGGGMSQREAARRVGVNYQTVLSWVNGRRNQQASGVVATSETKQQIVTQVSQGRAYHRIASDLNVSQTTVAKVVQMSSRRQCQRCNGTGWIYEERNP